MKSLKKIFAKGPNQIHAKELPSKDAKNKSRKPSDLKAVGNDREGAGQTPRSTLPVLKEEVPCEIDSHEFSRKNDSDRFSGSAGTGDGPKYIGVSLYPGSVEIYKPADAKTSSGLKFEHSESLNHRLAQLSMMEGVQFSEPPSTLPGVVTVVGVPPAAPISSQPPPSFQIDLDDPSAMSQDDLQRLAEDLASGSLPIQIEAAKKIRFACKSSDVCRKQVADADCIPQLTRLVQSGDSEMAEHAVTALLNLFILKDNRLDIAKPTIQPLVDAMKSGVEPVSENAAAAIFLLSLEDENKMEIGASGAAPPLVEILRSGSSTGKSDACKALFNLSILSDNKWRIVKASGVEALVEILEEPEGKLAERAVSTLAHLSTTPEGRNAIARHEEGIARLGEVLEGGSHIGKENASAALLQLAKHDPTHRQMIINEGLSPSLVALSQNGTPRAREKAEALLNNFREKRV